MILQTGGLAFGRNFDKVEIGVRGDAKGVFDTHDAYLLASWPDQSDFRYADALVDAGLSADGASLVADTVVHVATVAGWPGSQRWACHAISKKALQEQGPVPTDRGSEPPASSAEQAPLSAVTGPLSLENPVKISRPTVGVGLHLLSLASPGRSRWPV